MKVYHALLSRNRSWSHSTFSLHLYAGWAILFSSVAKQFVALRSLLPEYFPFWCEREGACAILGITRLCEQFICLGCIFNFMCDILNTRVWILGPCTLSPTNSPPAPPLPPPAPPGGTIISVRLMFHCYNLFVSFTSLMNCRYEGIQNVVVVVNWCDVRYTIGLLNDHIAYRLYAKWMRTRRKSL